MDLLGWGIQDVIVYIRKAHSRDCRQSSLSIKLGTKKITVQTVHHNQKYILRFNKVNGCYSYIRTIDITFCGITNKRSIWLIPDVQHHRIITHNQYIEFDVLIIFPHLRPMPKDLEEELSEADFKVLGISRNKVIRYKLTE